MNSLACSEVPVPALDVSGLAVAIDGQEILSDVSVTVASGGLTALVGETGSGKSVACRAIAGGGAYTGSEITAGRVTVGGSDVTARPGRGGPRSMPDGLAFVPQGSMDGLDSLMTVGRQVLETVGGGWQERRTRARSLELLRSVQMPRLPSVLSEYPHELSGGMRQRLVIALAIASRPRALIADEPTTALDASIKMNILNLLSHLRRELDLGVLLVTHDLALATAVADRVAVMYAGRTVEHGPAASVLNRPLHPYTRALLAAAPHGSWRDHRIQTIEGQPPTPSSWPPGCRFRPRCGLAIDQCAKAPPPLIEHEPDHYAACIRVAAGI